MKIKTAFFCALSAFVIIGCSGGGRGDGSNDSIRLPPAWTPTAITLPGGGIEEGTWKPCDDGPASQLQLGDRAMIEDSAGFAIRLRGEPGINGTIKGSIIVGDILEVTNGPACLDQMVWWELTSLGTGDSGWTAEGNSYGAWILGID